MKFGNNYEHGQANEFLRGLIATTTFNVEPPNKVSREAGSRFAGHFLLGIQIKKQILNPRAII
jgi:hypothetical protein